MTILQRAAHRMPRTAILSALALTGTASLLAGCGGDSATQTNLQPIDPAKPASGWQLVWSDDFTGSSIDSAKWNFEVNCAGGGNNEKQCYTADKANAFVADGMLNIVARPGASRCRKALHLCPLNYRQKSRF